MGFDVIINSQTFSIRPGPENVNMSANEKINSIQSSSDKAILMVLGTGLDIRLVDAVARGASRFENLLTPQKTYWPLPQNQTCAVKKIFA